MNAVEIPLLRESAVFARRLMAAAQAFAVPRYHWQRRVNWSYRLDADFYAAESAHFRADAVGYLGGGGPAPAPLADVYRRSLGARQVLVVVAKVAAHWAFHLLGRLADGGVRRDTPPIYRKAYVDDIELVFDPGQVGVLRAIYPFPINLRRQLSYIGFVRRRGMRFKLAGNPYLPGDALRFLVRRDVASLMRLESRAQLLHARQIAALGIREVQLSDEFDIGSLDLSRTLARLGVTVVNSAHGVGKYLPIHGYGRFHLLTQRQQDYYVAARPCQYSLRQLNDVTAAPAAAEAPAGPNAANGTVVRLVFLSQAFTGVSPIVADNEAELMALLGSTFAADPRVQLLYKPHPNASAAVAPRGFERVVTLDSVNGCADTLFASFFSTCQIDPAFKGRKVLVRGHWIFPEIAFDPSEPVYDAAGLVAYVAELAGHPEQAAPP